MWVCPRIALVYRKELVDIFRDRRTLIAMVVIPVAVYPLLLLGFARALEQERGRVNAQRLVMEVDSPAVRDWLEAVLATDRQTRPRPGDERVTFEVRVGSTTASAIGRDVQLLVRAELDPSRSRQPHRTRLHLVYNEVDYRSVAAVNEFKELLGRHADWQKRQWLGDLLSPGDEGSSSDDRVEAILEPFKIATASIATDRQRGGRLLSLIVPVLLLVMTATGAIYPAIDLTAGERERGTLESLTLTPVSTFQIVMGKFMVVLTIAMLSAILNLASMAATVHFAGLTQLLTSRLPVEMPLSAIPTILACMVPFAALFSALLVAVCSFARSFKEAQSYVMPTLMVVMAPAFLASLPTMQLRGVMLILPVANVVLLIRELLSQSCTATQVLLVMLSTSLYAAAAVVVAAQLFGQEAVLFPDAASYRTMLRRRFLRPAPHPTFAQALLLAALLFPVTFYVQSAIGQAMGGRLVLMLMLLALVQFAGLFGALPLGLAVYFKINVLQAFRLRRPTLRAWGAALLLGLSAWALSHEFLLAQARLIPPSDALLEFSRRMESQLGSQPLWLVLLLVALVPAAFEELLFRGFLLSGIGSRCGQWSSIVLVAGLFGLYHFMIDRIPATALFGVVLGYLAWQGRSIFPCILLHATHNGLMILLARMPGLAQSIGLAPYDLSLSPHLPAHTLIFAGGAFVAGLAMLASLRGCSRPADQSPHPMPLLADRLAPHTLSPMYSH